MSVNDVFKICGVTLCSIERNCQIRPTKNKEYRKTTLRSSQVFDGQVFLLQQRRQFLVRHHAAEVLKVVTNFGCGAGLSSDGEHKLTVALGFDYVVERIVLKDHWRRLPVKQLLAQSLIGQAQTTQTDRERCFDSDVDLQIRSTVRRDDTLEMLQKIRAQAFRDSFTTNNQVHPVLSEVERG